jgi:hypothetical protein
MYNRLKTFVNQVRDLGSTKWDDHKMIKVCRCFGPGGPSTESTSEFIAACPCPDGLAQDGTQGEMRPVLSHTGVARSRGYKRRERERESEPVRLLVPPRATPPSAGGP